ncbi:hypothetical protein M413DRAFT_446879 [Hebeloma cylindrosporum]|uniref:Peptidase A1 domain-containing protein n=1 Tax=Hebeloma cylindrosporum TaxID=76867 RepID=A0A0C2XQT7_HEBCY|nr:hypothetical protein M413DRAFT_446879 [Hebeloma cylindrosporum h7]
MLRAFLHSLVVLGLLLSTSHLRTVAAVPSLSQPSFLSIPISRQNNLPVSRADYVHGAILQQQHINTATKRLALMTGQAPPSDLELLWTIHQRISRLSTDLQRKYEFWKIAEILAFHRASSIASISHIALKTPSLSPRDAKLHNVPLAIQSNDYGYIGTFQLGTPLRDFRLLIDTGSADLWVGAEGCVADDGSGNCGKHNFLGPHSSSSYNQTKDTWAIGYVSGTVSGYLIRDTVSVAGIKLIGHLFGTAMNESSNFTPDNIPFDGLMGLGKQAISQQRVTPFLQSLYQAHLIPAPIASYRISRRADHKNDGELTIGALNPKHYDPSTLVTKPNVNKFGYWGVGVDAVHVGKKNMQWPNRTILIDTGTTLLIAPKDDVDAIHALIPGSTFDGQGWSVPCNMTTIISLTIGGRAFSIDPRDIAFAPIEYGSDICMSGIGIGGVGPFYQNTDWLAGDVFLKNVYFSTDESKDQVSIAKLKS